MDPQATQNLLGVTLAVAQDNPLSPPQTAVKSEPGAAKTPKAGAGSLKMKLMMSPKDSPGVVDSVITTSGSIPAMFFGRDETDGTPADDTGNSSGKKKPPAKKKKATAASEKTSKQTSKSPSAAEQMPNLAALVSGPKSKKGVKEEPNLSLSDHIDTSMSDASLDMSSIVDSALDMEEEAALVIAEGAAAASSKQKKKRSNTSGRKKAKAAAAELHGFDSDEDTTAPPDGDLATLAAKVQRGSSAAGSKKKSAKKLHEAAAQRVSMQGKKKRPPRRAPTAYMLYCNSQRPKVVAESPGIVQRITHQ
nr:hypothetical protein BaRGS_016985 [Batillaria attramentaria]